MLVSYAADMEPGEVARRYMQSTEFADDVTDFDVANIVDVESTILVPFNQFSAQVTGTKKEKEK